jgi:uncharacterized DUF497 family protein
MSFTFEWDDEKALENLRKHGISFSEASMVFADSLSRTIPDPLHSEAEERMIILASRACNTPWLWCIPIAERSSELLAPGTPRREREKIMSEEENKEVEMLDEYDFSTGVIGKYAKQYAEGTNIVLLEPDVAKVFPDSAAVNQALRQIIEQRSQ